MKKRIVSLGLSVAMLATMTVAGMTARAESSSELFSDNFDGRTALGDNYVSTAAEDKLLIQDGRLVLNNPVDATGIFPNVNLQSDYTMKFDVYFGDPAGMLAIMTGLSAQASPGNYWTAGTTRIGLTPALYNVGEAGAQLTYTPNSGVDTDPAAAGGNAWWRISIPELDEGEGLTVQLAFEGDTMRMYYKKISDPDWMLYQEHSSWVGVKSQGYLGFLAWGAPAAMKSITSASFPASPRNWISKRIPPPPPSLTPRSRWTRPRARSMLPTPHHCAPSRS